MRGVQGQQTHYHGKIPTPTLEPEAVKMRRSNVIRWHMTVQSGSITTLGEIKEGQRTQQRAKRMMATKPMMMEGDPRSINNLPDHQVDVIEEHNRDAMQRHA